MHFCYLDLFQGLALILTLFTGGPLQHHAWDTKVLHQFINMNSFGKVHQELQSSRISRDLDDVQTVINLCK